MRKLSFFIIGFIGVFCFYNTVFCTPKEDIIKVGLTSKFHDISKVSISNSSLYFGIIKNDLFYGSESISGSDFSIVSGMNYYISSNDIYKSFKEAKLNSSENGIPVLIDKDCWKVYFGGYSSEKDASFDKNKFKENCEVVKSKENIIVLSDGDTPKVILDSSDYFACVKDGGEGVVNIDGEEYRGGLEFIKNGDVFNVINTLSLDEYLYGVVPCEMSNEWHKEALKAQSVVARCFALSTGSGKHSNDYYDVCDSSHCQVYGGFSAEKEETNLAVDETSKIAAYYNGEIIEGNYFSSSGGSTANAKDVWGTEVPYLKAVLDSDETEFKIWTRVFSFSEMTEISSANGENIGNVVKVYIASKDEFGRVNSLVIEGDKGNITLDGEKIRTFFSKSKDGILLSRNFSMDSAFQFSGEKMISQNIKIYVLGKNGERQTEFVNIKTLSKDESNLDFLNLDKVTVIGSGQTKIYDKTERNIIPEKDKNKMEAVSGDIVFYGKGMGHGVGMSQMGAKALAESGKSYIDILNHYYTGIEIKKFND